MRKILSTILLAGFGLSDAQVIIGDASGTAADKTSVLLEFAAGQNKGLVLPYVRTLPSPTALTAGTVLLDASTPNAARVKFSNGTDWVDLSGQDADVTAVLSVQPTGIDETGGKTIIGARTSAADGVLVLESTTKAMVLPVVGDVQDIAGPSPGMMVYVNASGGKRLAVYNGSKWSFWKATETAVGTVTSTTGKIWMDRNLGASRVAASSTDAAAYGDLYQWGRGTDGHQLRTSASTTVLSSSDTPGHGDFIFSTSGNRDWRSPQNDNLWQGVNGINNPCPGGFRLPTVTEFSNEIATFSTPDAAGAFASPLKLTVGGYREFYDGVLYYDGVEGIYWSSTVQLNTAQLLYLTSGNAVTNSTYRTYGSSLRCIKD